MRSIAPPEPRVCKHPDCPQLLEELDRRVRYCPVHRERVWVHWRYSARCALEVPRRPEAAVRLDLARQLRGALARFDAMVERDRRIDPLR